MRIVPRAARYLEPAEGARALHAAFTRTGRPPTLVMAEILLAQIWFETGGHPNNFNVGNLFAAGFSGGAEVAHFAGDAWRPPWFENPGQETGPNAFEHREMLSGRAPSAFRAYSTLETGLADWLGMMAHKFSPLLEAAGAGDLAAFARLYRETGYCPPCEPHATELAFAQRRNQLRQAGAFDGVAWAPPTGPGKAGKGGPAFLAALAVGSAVLVWLAQRKRAA